MNKFISLAVVGLAFSTQASASFCFHPDEDGGGYWCAFVPIVDTPNSQQTMQLSELVLNPETDRYEIVARLSTDTFQERSVWSDHLGEYVPYGMALKTAYDAAATAQSWDNAPGLVARNLTEPMEPCPVIATRSEGFSLALLDHYHFDN